MLQPQVSHIICSLLRLVFLFTKISTKMQISVFGLGLGLKLGSLGVSVGVRDRVRNRINENSSYVANSVVD